MRADSIGLVRVRWLALVSGVVAVLLALLTPLLPVRQDRAALDWPQAGSVDVTAPLVAYVPLDVDISVPCGAIRDLPSGTVLSTVPAQAAGAGAKGLLVTVDDRAPAGRTLSVLLRDIPLLSVPVDEITGAAGESGTGCGALTVTSTAGGTTAELTGIHRRDGTAFRDTVAQDIRPHMVGVFSDLTRDRLAAAHLHANLDSRFSSSPSLLKYLAITGAVLCTILALISLHLLDTADGRRPRRFLPAGWWRIRLADVAIIGTLLVWYVIGANTSDDGYILTMARASKYSGYMANYYRWFGVAEAPFGWPYELLAQLTRVTDAGLWMRLPALLAGIACWLVISREVLPRLGTRVRHSTVARWTAGLVFLAAWLPYDNGLRPEPLIALGALLTWCSIERAVATARLLPAAVAVLIAAFSLAAGPTGLICLAALIAGSRPVLRTIVARAKADNGSVSSVVQQRDSRSPQPATARAEESGTTSAAGRKSISAGDTGARPAADHESGTAGDPDPIAGAGNGTAAAADRGTGQAQRRGIFATLLRYGALLAPGAAAGTLVLVVVFADQPLAAVLEATRVRRVVGPNVAWFDERTRWDALLMLSPDGSLARRFGVLAMLLCLGVCVLVMLRKGGRIPDTAKGPSSRLLGIVFMSLLLMMFTPTKWTHHFGVYAGLAGALAALTTAAVGSNGIRAPYNRSLFAAATLFVLAVTFTGSNGWWYVSSYGVPWFDKAPLVAGKGLSTAFLGLAVLSLLFAGYQYYREPYRKHPAAKRFDRFAIEPLTVAAAMLVLFEVASLAKGAIGQYPAYSVASSNLRALKGDTCGLADQVLVETDTADSLLQPYQGSAAEALAGTAPGGTGNASGETGTGPGEPGRSVYGEAGTAPSGSANSGFTPDGVAADLTADADETVSGGANSVGTDNKNKTTRTTAAGTGGGSTTTSGVNGSTVALPFGLDPARTPILGSYVGGPKQPAHLTTGWYRLDLAAAQRDPAYQVLVVTAAGRIRSVDKDGVVTYGQDLRIQFAHRADDGTVQPLGEAIPADIGGAPSWRNLRLPLDRIPAGTNAIRLTAVSADLTERQWLAITPPRLPKLAALNSIVGSRDPVLADWHVGLAFPCQRPFDHRDGVAEVPRWRILPDRVGSDAANAWQDDIGGGPLGWTGLLLKAQTVPAYLDHDWGRDWGELEQFTPYLPAPAANIAVTVQNRWGWVKDAPIETR